MQAAAAVDKVVEKQKQAQKTIHQRQCKGLGICHEGSWTRNRNCPCLAGLFGKCSSLAASFSGLISFCALWSKTNSSLPPSGHDVSEGIFSLDQLGSGHSNCRLIGYIGSAASASDERNLRPVVYCQDYDKGKGFGFILDGDQAWFSRRDEPVLIESQEKIFVHQSQIVAPGFRMLVKDQKAQHVQVTQRG